jgi:hypothetical protein
MVNDVKGLGHNFYMISPRVLKDTSVSIKTCPVTLTVVFELLLKNRLRWSNGSVIA